MNILDAIQCAIDRMMAGPEIPQERADGEAIATLISLRNECTRDRNLRELFDGLDTLWAIEDREREWEGEAPYWEPR